MDYLCRAVYGASAARNALPLSLKREAAAAEGGRELDSDALSFEVQVWRLAVLPATTVKGGKGRGGATSCPLRSITVEAFEA